MNLGRMDKKIEIKEFINTPNTGGEDEGVSTLFHTAFANVQRVSGNERLDSDQVTATNKVRFKIHVFAGITEAMTIEYDPGTGTQIYDIKEVQELGREGLSLTATRQE